MELREIFKKSFSNLEMKVLGPAVTKEVCDKYKIRSVEKYRFILNGETKHKRASDASPIFCMEEDDFYIMYEPFAQNKAYRFIQFGKRPKNYLFGFEQFKAVGKQPLAIIVYNHLDLLNLAGNGYYPIFIPESSRLNATMYHAIAERCEHVCVLPDTDPTGIESASRLCKKFPMHLVLLPKTVKDYRDFVSKYPNREDTAKLFDCIK